MALPFGHQLAFRVRYSETDQLGTFYNSRALEWFECGRTELLRAAGITYADMERRGLFLPLVEAHVQYHGRARYDDLLLMTSTLSLAGKASLRFDVEIVHAQTPAWADATGGGATPGKPLRVAAGYTTHALTDTAGRPCRTPAWLLDALNTPTPPLTGAHS